MDLSTFSLRVLTVLVTVVSAFLLFLIQPMIAKMLLPFFGGGASVWLVCVLFFQVVLLCGYLVANVLALRLPPRGHFVVQALLVALSLAFVSFPSRAALAAEHPQLAPALLLATMLAAAIGFPFLMLSTTSPTTQWIWARDEARAGQAYLLYAASNLGSLAGLFAYPFFVEQRLTLSGQVKLWTLLYAGYALLMVLCCSLALLEPKRQDALAGPRPRQPLLARLQGRWFLQALIPSCGLLAVTQAITADLVNVPLLWILPLALYLLSFVACFLFPGLFRPSRPLQLIVLLSVLVATLVYRDDLPISLFARTAALCACSFFIFLYFHGNLEHSKPPSGELTSYYLTMSLGAAAGSLFVAVLSPLLFHTTFEFYVWVIVCLGYVVHQLLAPSGRPRVALFACSLAALLALAFVTQEWLAVAGVTFRSRTFYSTYTVQQVASSPGQQRPYRLFSVGERYHGAQSTDLHDQLIPTTYYHEKTGVGRILQGFPALRTIGAVGLGVGTIAFYGRPDQRFDFFELDPEVIRIAGTHFDYLRTSRATIRLFAGDGRLELRKQPAASYDLLVLDAFSSGSIPIHLVTQEAIEECLRVLRPAGAILYHTSNDHVSLLPVLQGIAQRLGLHAVVHRAGGDPTTQRFAAEWVLLTRDRDLLVAVTRDAAWGPIREQPLLWTDERSNLWDVVSIQRRLFEDRPLPGQGLVL